MRSLVLFPLFIAFLSSLLLAAPTRSTYTPPKGPPALYTLLSAQLSDAESAAKIAASYQMSLAQTRVSWLSRLLHGNEKNVGGKNCFCAGGSLCCYEGPGQLDCNLNCGI